MPRLPRAVRKAFQKGLAILLPLLLWVGLAAPSQPWSDEQTESAAPTFNFLENSVALRDTNPRPFSASGGLFERQGYKPVIDTALEQIYESMAEHDLDTALAGTNRLIKEFPNFALAHLLRGDILSMKAGRRLKQIGDVPNLPKGKADDLEKLREEAMARFKAVKDRPKKDLLPSELMVLNREQKYVILVDTNRSRLFLYENSFPHPRLVTDFYVSQGKKGAVKEREGDKKTPIGVYTITELLPKSKLNDFYGPIALPINYPNNWDKRLGKTGYGIWLHGMPSRFASRPPRDSDGCVVLANQDLLALKEFVDIGNTQVIISENLDFVPVEVWKSQKQAALKLIKSWKDDLEANLQTGLKHYSSEVVIDGQSLSEWRAKLPTQVTSLGKIKLDDISVLKYPSQDSMMVVSFDQDNDVLGQVRKEQYWMKIGTRWQIVQEQSTKL